MNAEVAEMIELDVIPYKQLIQGDFDALQMHGVHGFRPARLQVEVCPTCNLAGLTPCTGCIPSFIASTVRKMPLCCLKTATGSIFFDFMIKTFALI